jgi:CRISPR-associated protein Csb1
LKDAPATFRKVSTTAAKYMHEFRDGAANPERRVLGGVLVNTKGRIEREVTVNLVALRGLRGANNDETTAIRKYLLGLSLMAATADIELFLREGCLLRYAENGDAWYQVPRRGEPTTITLDPAMVTKYASTTAAHFRPRWPKDGKLKHEFNLAEAKKLLAKKAAGEESAAGGVAG